VFGFRLDPAKLTANQYLDRWLAHIRTNRRARTVARSTALLRDYVRPSIGARPLKQLTPLEIQAIYDHLAVSGRRDGKSRRAGPPAHPGRAPLPPPRPGPSSHLAAARPQPRHPRHPTTAARPEVVATAPRPGRDAP
jgi:Phage integrase, N-terminal SAM-like domain